jgi:hypothetical protein
MATALHLDVLMFMQHVFAMMHLLASERRLSRHVFLAYPPQ